MALEFSVELVSGDFHYQGEGRTMLNIRALEFS